MLLLFESILNFLPSFLPSFLPYLKRWQACVNPGRWITTDESQVAGWYHSVMTIGPDPKPIRTGATLHTACITKGPLATYKIFARVYGGEGDQDINRRNPHTVRVHIIKTKCEPIWAHAPKGRTDFYFIRKHTIWAPVNGQYCANFQTFDVFCLFIKIRYKCITVTW
jgi:hypothetical protein